jgi:hypothetical protein
MKKLIVISVIALLTTSSTLFGQTLNDEDAIVKVFSGENIGGKYLWNFKDTIIKNIALNKLEDPNVLKTKKGIVLLSYGFTSQTNDVVSDRIFLKHTLERTTRVDSIFEGADFVRNHFLKTDYDALDLKKITYYSMPHSVLYWKDWTPYYLSFLEIHNIDSTLLFFKKNIDAINQLHYSLYNIHNRYDTLDVNVCLARLMKVSDTLVINQLDDRFNSHYSKNYLVYFERLARIRTPMAFHKIGNFLISDLNDIMSDGEQKHVRQMALAVFLAYVKNFPDRSTKWQDTFNLWGMVRLSHLYGKDYATDEYMEMAKRWYMLNKDNLILDMDKY